jgi:hypothetical protein
VSIGNPIRGVRLKALRRRLKSPLHRPRHYVVLAVVVAVIAANSPVITQYVSAAIHQYEIDRPSYEAKYGHWQVVEVPTPDRVDAVHTALLQTGKLLIVAGSGNNQQFFERGTFKTLLWDPKTGKAKLIPTPADMFCGGHAFLPNGNLLVAGGTSRYEVLASAVKYAGGAMYIENDSLVSYTLAQGTIFVAPDGALFKSDVAITLSGGTRAYDRHGRPMIRPSDTDVWVDALAKGHAGVVAGHTPYHIVGLTPAEAAALTAEGQRMTLEKQNFQGTNLAFEFDPQTERYVAVLPMPHKRWYPTLTTLENGEIMAVSGLDGAGVISPGNNDIFDPKTGHWSKGPFRYFPTYPALFLTASGKLFYSGSSTGYGPATEGRKPGLWNLKNNSFQFVPGLPDPTETETSGSVLLPPAQAQKVMILGGGGVGTSPLVTARTAIADLASPHPTYTAGPRLAQPARYPLSVILPDDTVLVTGGAKQYRGERASDNHIARIYHPDTNTFTVAASPSIGRDYHSEAVLLPDGRVATLGSNPLYGNSEDTAPGYFEQRIEIYSPPYLFHGPRPVISGGPQQVALGASTTFTTSSPADIQKVRLIHPSAATHDTDLEQRSITLAFTRTADGVHVTIPPQQSLVPLGWYMLFVDNAKGVPSVARWVQVVA